MCTKSTGVCNGKDRFNYVRVYGEITASTRHHKCTQLRLLNQHLVCIFILLHLFYSLHGIIQVQTGYYLAHKGSVTLITVALNYEATFLLRLPC